MAADPAPKPQLRQEEQLWLSSEINQPSWNFISGIGFFLFSAGLLFTVITSTLDAPTKLIAGFASLLIVVPGLYFVKIGLARIRPLRRLRAPVEPTARLTVRAIAGHSPDVLVLELSNGRDYVLTGPLVNHLAKVNMLHGACGPDDLTVDFFSTPGEHAQAPASPVRLHIGQAESAIGSAEWYGDAAQ